LGVSSIEQELVKLFSSRNGLDMSNKTVLFVEVKKVINAHDPVGLISGGAPEDEYDSEIIKVTRLLPSDRKALAEGIHDIFVKSFDEQSAGGIERYELIAEKILERFSAISA